MGKTIHALVDLTVDVIIMKFIVKVVTLDNVRRNEFFMDGHVLGSRLV